MSDLCNGGENLASNRDKRALVQLLNPNRRNASELLIHIILLVISLFSFQYQKFRFIVFNVDLYMI